MEELTGALPNSDKGWTILTPPDRPRTLIFAVGWHSCSGFEVVETIWWNLFFN